MTVLRRISWGILVVDLLFLVGWIIWRYPAWPSSILLISSVVVANIGRAPGGQHPQENDPNRR